MSTFTLENMPNLKYIRNGAVDLFPIGKNFSRFLFPQLQTLCLDCKKADSKTKAYEEFFHDIASKPVVHCGITFLRMKSTSSVSRFVGSVFPNLRKLEVTLSYTKSDDEEDELVELLTDAFQQFRSMKNLKHLKVGIEFSYNLSDLVTALCKSGDKDVLYPGLTTLEINNSQSNTVPRIRPQDQDHDTTCPTGLHGCEGHPSPSPNGGMFTTERFLKVFLMTSHLQGFFLTNFLMGGGTAQEIMRFISDHKLPVVFRDYDTHD